MSKDVGSLTMKVELPQLERLIKELEKTRKAVEKSNRK